MKKILLVEDTFEVHENLKELLVMEDYEVKGATNGKEALDVLNQFQADLIITDLRMPVMDGFALIENLKTNELLNRIPIVVFSANTTPENEAKCLELGTDAFLKKPCTTEELLLTIERLIPGNQPE